MHFVNIIGMSVRYIEYEAVLEINKEIIKKMGGKFAVINEGNLRYCIESVKDIGSHSTLVDSCIHKSAYYMCCISESHVLLDYNKRTAYQTANVFLLANGFEFHVVDADDAVSMLRHASRKKIAIENVKQWVTKHIKPISA